MTLFLLRNRNPQELASDNMILRAPDARDYAEWKALRQASAEFLIPFEPLWPVDDLSRAGFKRRLGRYWRDAKSMAALTWFIFVPPEGLVGGLTLSNIRYGASNSCQLGYWMGEVHAGKGIMRNAVQLVLNEAFGHLGLDRVEAATLPGNARSINLLIRIGFQCEGFVRAYLEINGERRDHNLYAIVRADIADIRAPVPV